MQIKIAQPKDIEIRKQEKVNTDTILINEVTDDFNSVVTAVVSFMETGQVKRLILWEGPAYVTIGEWTTADVIARLKVLL